MRPPRGLGAEAFGACCVSISKVRSCAVDVTGWLRRPATPWTIVASGNPRRPSLLAFLESPPGALDDRRYLSVSYHVGRHWRQARSQNGRRPASVATFAIKAIDLDGRERDPNEIVR